MRLILNLLGLGRKCELPGSALRFLPLKYEEETGFPCVLNMASNFAILSQENYKCEVSEHKEVTNTFHVKETSLKKIFF
jgi:hypothetical protein